MQKSILAVAVLTAIGLAVPLASSAQAEVTKKVIIKHGDRGHHYGWRHRDYGWRDHHHGKKVVIIKNGHRHYD